MDDLVAFAGQLAEVAGGYDAAATLAHRMGEQGTNALDVAHGDVRLALRAQARELGLVDAEGRAALARTALLIMVCEVLRAAPPGPQPTRGEPSLVFTVPEPAHGLVEPRERLDLFVERVIRMATSEVLLGGPFWNDPGMQRLLNVLAPAITERGVTCAFYVHAWPDAEARNRLRALVGALGGPPQVRIWWYQGPAQSLMHAKFVVADRREGYLGTANLTSQGLEQHVEIGVGLGARQCEQLRGLLCSLTKAGLFVADPGGADSSPGPPAAWR